MLTDKSTARNTFGERIPLATVEASDTVVKGDTTYYIYETLQQGSPNIQDRSRDTFRRGLCVTAVRPGESGTPYLYTLAFACPEKTWATLEGGFKKGIESFELIPTGSSFIPPDKNPWAFI